MTAGSQGHSRGWMLDELAFAGRENLDPHHVARYDGKEDAGARDEVGLLQRWGLTQGSVVVDIGAGTGQFTYEHEGEPADVIYTRLALHHLPDAWKAIALAPVRRILRPGGLLRLHDVVYDFAPDEAPERLEAWCATGGDGVVGEWSRAELEEHVRDEHSTFTWLLEPMIRRSGFEIE